MSKLVKLIDKSNRDLIAENRGLQMQIDGLQAEIARLNHQHANDEAANRMLSEACERQQSRIDTLMLEFCPDDMTPTQIAEWAQKQSAPVEPEEVYSVHTHVQSLT